MNFVGNSIEFFKNPCDPKYDWFDRLVKIVLICTSNIYHMESSCYSPEDDIILRFVDIFIVI